MCVALLSKLYEPFLVEVLGLEARRDGVGVGDVDERHEARRPGDVDRARGEAAEIARHEHVGRLAVKARGLELLAPPPALLASKSAA